ncbi:MAG: FecR domain-containing protein [Candidatus Eisenbacteria bacterium]|uniref:FecR domain-containing protein n=1 Tax=Eiseniibacteriota bacterium TaxID=2212470 RepID=A0A538TPB3_UNCEI|nr:MAG: FecR domain-containing protein [Candidatus Eisenbacteria bacterium]
MAWDSVPRPTKPDGGSLLPGMWKLLLEVFLAIAMTLACFSGFLAVLSVVFPPGDDMRTLMAGVRLAGPSGRLLEPDLLDPIEASSSPVAKLTVKRRDVKRRSAGQIGWSPAASGVELYDRDAVQTGPDGAAAIEYGPKVAVQVEENALVVVTGLHLGADPIESPRGLSLLQGDLTARIGGSYDAPIEVEIPAGRAILRAEPGGTADVRIKVGRDRSTSVAVLGGSLELAANGRKIHVGPSQFSRVDSGGRIQEPRPIPIAPAVLEPADGSSFPYLDLPPRVTFRWSPVENADGYRVRVEKGPAFRDLALDEMVTAPSLTWGRLAVGSYRWSVAAIQDEIEGLPSAARRLTVTLEGELLPLQIDPPPTEVEGSRFTVRGRTDPRARVYVMGQRLQVNLDGSFQVEVRLKAGANLLLVEAVDPAGHSSYWSQVLRAKF